MLGYEKNMVRNKSQCPYNKNNYVNQYKNLVKILILPKVPSILTEHAFGLETVIYFTYSATNPTTVSIGIMSGNWSPSSFTNEITSEYGYGYKKILNTKVPTWKQALNWEYRKPIATKIAPTIEQNNTHNNSSIKNLNM